MRLTLMNKKFDIYIKKLTTQELGYRKGRLKTGGYFYISKSAVGPFFKKLNKNILNDFLRIDFNDPLEPGKIIQASYVYHNDKFIKENGTRDEYRIYHNRDIATHELHFQPHEIVVFVKKNENEYIINHFTRNDREYIAIEKSIQTSSIRGNHALMQKNEYKKLLILD